MDKIRDICLLSQNLKLNATQRKGYAFLEGESAQMQECGRCQGTGYVSEIDEKGYRRVRACEGTISLKRADLFNLAYIPARYAEASFDSYHPQTATVRNQVEVLKRYIERFEPGNKGRAFFGDPGTGKTHLLAACIRYLTLEKAIPCRYVEFTQLLFDIRNVYSENKPEASLINPLVALPVLFIDELGKGKCNEFEIRIIDEIITRRYNDPSLSTFFASNYYPRNLIVKKNPSKKDAEMYAGMDFLEDRIQFRSASRIFEICEFITLRGDDYRQKLQHR